MNRSLVRLLDHHAVQDVVTRLFVKTDEREWEAVRSCLARTVRFDMSSAGGGPPEQKTPEEITDRWRTALEPLEAIHHQVGNFLVHVDDEEAECSCYGIASHYRPNPSGRNTRTFVGTYRFHLCQEGHRWRIDTIRFDLKYVEGNVELTG